MLAGVLSSCENRELVQNKPGLSENLQTPVQENIVVKEEKQLPLFINYRIDSIETEASVDSFKQKYTAPEQEFIFALNRMDAHRLSPGHVIIIPDTLTGDFMDYSPFPVNFEMLDSIPKVVLISRRIQGFALYENGKLLHWGPVSSGKKSTPTPAGLFYGNHKALRKVSTVNESWILPYYFNFMNFEGVGVHEYDMPGYPASHACVRLKKEDAKMIYNWAHQWKLDKSGQIVERNGTPFMVYGDYNFAGSVPWLDLAANPNSNFLTAKEMEILKEYTIQFKKDKRNFDPSAAPAEILPVPVKEGLETVQ